MHRFFTEDPRQGFGYPGPNSFIRENYVCDCFNILTCKACKKFIQAISKTSTPYLDNVMEATEK